MVKVEGKTPFSNILEVKKHTSQISEFGVCFQLLVKSGLFELDWLLEDP